MQDFNNIKIIIAYDGSNYHGWQRQKEKNTLQRVIEDSIKSLTGENEIKLNGSGRTDTGVHAVGQVANFITKTQIPVDKWPIALNYKLPNDIRIMKAEKVNMEFHSRYDAKSRIYRYYVMDSIGGEKQFATKIIFLRNYCYFIRPKLDIKMMGKVANYLVGYHDFSALSCLNQHKNKMTKSKDRKISNIEICRRDNLIYFSIEADAFLYKMVRIIIGTMIDFSISHREPEEIKQILKNKDSQKSGKVIPPQGLYLMKVKYV